MKELNSKFLSLLCYVPYIVVEKLKVQWFLSCLPFHIKDIIEYDNPKTLEEAMRKANLCYEQKLGTMNMKELNSKFLSLLRYVPYIVDEKPKVQQFLSCLPFHIKDIIEYDNPKTLEEAMRKAIFFYEQNHKKESMSNWKAKRSNNFEQKKKGFISNRNFMNNNTRNFSNKNFQGNKGNS